MSRRSQSVMRAVGRAREKALVERLAGRVIRLLPVIRGFPGRPAAIHLRALKPSPLVASIIGHVRVSLALRRTRPQRVRRVDRPRSPIRSASPSDGHGD